MRSARPRVARRASREQRCGAAPWLELAGGRAEPEQRIHLQHRDCLNGPAVATDAGSAGFSRTDMLKKIVVFLVAVVAGLAALGFVMYERNAAPLVPTISAVEARSSSKPYVI